MTGSKTGALTYKLWQLFGDRPGGDSTQFSDPSALRSHINRTLTSLPITVASANTSSVITEGDTPTSNLTQASAATAVHPTATVLGSTPGNVDERREGWSKELRLGATISSSLNWRGSYSTNIVVSHYIDLTRSGNSPY